MAPLTVMDEVNTGTNLPAQIDIQAAPGREYRFFFIAKGGGSSNKIALFQESKARLEDGALEAFLAEKIRALGVAACPPYRIAVVVGGLSPEMTLKTVKLASAGFLDGLPKRGSKKGGAFRDLGWEERTMRLARDFGSRGPVRRRLAGPRSPLRPPAAPRRLVPHRDRSLVQCRPRPARQDHFRGRLPRRGRAPAGPLPRRRAPGGPGRGRRCRSRSAPGRGPGQASRALRRHPGQAVRAARRRPGHRPRPAGPHAPRDG